MTYLIVGGYLIIKYDGECRYEQDKQIDKKKFSKKAMAEMPQSFSFAHKNSGVRRKNSAAERRL